MQACQPTLMWKLIKTQQTLIFRILKKKPKKITLDRSKKTTALITGTNLKLDDLSWRNEDPYKVGMKKEKVENCERKVNRKMKWGRRRILEKYKAISCC